MGGMELTTFPVSGQELVSLLRLFATAMMDFACLIFFWHLESLGIPEFIRSQIPLLVMKESPESHSTTGLVHHTDFYVFQ